MAQLPNPNTQQPYTTYHNKLVPDGKGGMKEAPEYGERIVDGHSEIVHLETGQSNMQYHQPESVLNPEGCNHLFHIIDIGKREVECHSCKLLTSFHPAVNFFEEDGKAYIFINHRRYEISL